MALKLVERVGRTVIKLTQATKIACGVGVKSHGDPMTEMGQGTFGLRLIQEN